jgi:hypothetical protein
LAAVKTIEKIFTFAENSETNYQLKIQILMKKIVVFALAAILLYSCSSSTPKADTAAGSTQKAIEITNDMENATAVIPSWINEKTVAPMTNPPAHSGDFACITNDSSEYGYAYQEILKNINSVLPKRVVVSGWVYSTVATPNVGIILNISENNQQYDWKTYPLADNIKETGKWVEFSTSFYFDKPLNENQEVRIFPWNQSKKPIYFDDFKIVFEY